MSSINFLKKEVEYGLFTFIIDKWLGPKKGRKNATYWNAIFGKHHTITPHGTCSLFPGCLGQEIFFSSQPL